jgi:hypothetical protein
MSERGVPASGARPSGLPLAGYSFLILFFELALIRYLPAYVRVFGFYLNFVLLATFLGMGVGLLRADAARRLRWLVLPAVLGLFLAAKVFSNVLVEPPRDPDEPLWAVYVGLPETVRRVGILPVATILFALAALFFVPLGACLGREFRKFAPLHAYSLDIGGSLVGILAFAAASAWGTPPVLWFGAGFGLWTLLSLRDRGYALGVAGAGAAAVAGAAWTAGPAPEYWSPYYRVNVRAHAAGYVVYVNGSMHQFLLALDTASVRRHPFLAAVRADYLRPFERVARVDTALVLGAGTGNDVGLLLEMGARYVDAVEIDPAILALGRAGRDPSPYDDPRVHAVVDDARAFLRRTDRRYDVIVLGTLDSQTLLSGMSSLRLDNYVYTVEAFRAARVHLKPGGALVTYHMSPLPWIAAKIRGLLREAFGEEPVAWFEPQHRLFNYTFVSGGRALPAPPAPAWVLQDAAVPTDDWPYLYLRRPTLPGHYLRALAAVLACALLAVGAARARSSACRSSSPRPSSRPSSGSARTPPARSPTTCWARSRAASSSTHRSSGG